MKDKKIPIPRLLLDKINAIDHYDRDYILNEFYKSKNIYNKEQMELCDFEELYCEYECFVRRNFSEGKMLPKIILKKYFESIEEKEKKLNELDNFDCELMKLSHIKF